MYTLDLESDNAELKKVVVFCLENILLLLSPILPHFCEELFERMDKQVESELGETLVKRVDLMRKNADEEAEIGRAHV